MSELVFLDTVGLIALWESRDQWHRSAKDAFVRLIEQSADFASTSYVLAECANSAARKPYRENVSRLRLELEASGNLIHPTGEEWGAAWDSYGRSDAGGAGLVDQISFTVMKRLDIRRAFTNDRHFAAAGFEPLF